MTTPERIPVPAATRESILKIGDAEIRCYHLDNGKRLLNCEDVERFFGCSWEEIFGCSWEEMDKLLAAASKETP